MYEEVPVVVVSILMRIIILLLLLFINYVWYIYLLISSHRGAIDQVIKGGKYMQCVIIYQQKYGNSCLKLSLT